MIGHVFEIIDTIHLLDVVFTSIEQPSQVATFNFERKLFVLPDTAVLHFVKFIKLSLEENEVTARLAFGVHHGLFKFLEGVDNFEEAAMLEEVLVVFGLSFRNDSFNWDQEGVLIVVSLERACAVGLQSKS